MAQDRERKGIFTLKNKQTKTFYYLFQVNKEKILKFQVSERVVIYSDIN